VPVGHAVDERGEIGFGIQSVELGVLDQRVDDSGAGAALIGAQEQKVLSRATVDNGPEFVSNALDRWANENKVTLDYSRPGRPSNNALVESFNGRLREDCAERRRAPWLLAGALR
jgi:hypothetical protein